MLSRKKNQKIVIGDNVTIVVLEVKGDRVKIGIEAPLEMRVDRSEIWIRVQAEKASGSEPDEHNKTEVA